MSAPMNDLVEKSFTEWLISIEEGQRLGERDLTDLRAFETDEPNPQGESPEVELELDADGFFNPF